LRTVAPSTTPASQPKNPFAGITSTHVKYAVAVVALLVVGSVIRTYILSRPHPSAPSAAAMDLEKQVKEALASSGSFEHEQIKVTARDGEITLKGTVSAPWKQEAAGDLAAAVPGVLHVTNLIAVREAEQKADTPWRSGETGVATDGSATPGAAATVKHAAHTQTVEEQVQDLIQQGQWELHNKNNAAATKDFKAALALDPQNYEARSGLMEAETMHY
jgi:hypothetical protein